MSIFVRGGYIETTLRGMRFQKDTYSCGPAALSNALKALGHNVSERRIRAFSNTTEKDGTSELGICDAAEGLKFCAAVVSIEKRKEAVLWLAECLSHGFPVILSVSNGQHWATAVGVLGNRFIICDPGKFVYNLKENGVRVFTRRHLLETWSDAKVKGFMGIVISERGKKSKGT